MRISEREYDEFADDHFPNMVVLREWDDCKVWSAGVDELQIILYDRVNCRVSVYTYDDSVERKEFIDLVLQFKEGDNPDAGNPARVVPMPPGRSGSNAAPLPREES